jgi:hypothetical protein
MLQVYCFHEYGDVQEAYRKLNAFLADLAGLDIDVPLDQIRTNTKTYPDYGQTATTIEIAVSMEALAAYEVAGQITEMHQRVLNSRVEVPTPEPTSSIAEAYRLIKDAGAQMFLDHNEEGWVLTDLRDQGHVFWGVSRDDVLVRVQRALGIQPAPVPASDFDPFLDESDLP